MSLDIAQRIRRCPNLPTLPAIAIQILELASRPDADFAEIARAISKDPALSGKILRTVNSSFYARRQHVGTVSQALVILGLQAVKTLVLGFSLVTNLSQNRTRGFNHLKYWRRSIYAATAARTIAAKLNIAQQEEALLAALLQDIGMLVLDQTLGAQYGEICEKASTHAELIKVEKQILGMTHTEVGAQLAEQWKLPALLAVPIGASHNADAVTDPKLRPLAQLVQLAGACADVFCDESPAAIVQVRSFCAAHYKMGEADCDQWLQEIATKTKEMASLFELNLGPTADYEMILKKANEALVELTLQTQMRARQLQVQNQALQRQATIDPLTGLSNRTSIDHFLIEQFEASRKHGKPLTLLMLDLDNFKLVNDHFGHQAGDQVLMRLGKLMQSAARRQDLAGRYGGEEFVLILPETPRATGTAIAETIRRAVAAQPVVFGEQKIAITVSIGVATLEPGGPLNHPAHLVKAADMATYAAKHAGRNCVKIFFVKPAA